MTSTRLRNEIFQRLIWGHGKSAADSEPGCSCFMCRTWTRARTEQCCSIPAAFPGRMLSLQLSPPHARAVLSDVAVNLPQALWETLHNLIRNSSPENAYFGAFNHFKRKLHIKCYRIGRKSAEFQGLLIFFYSAPSLKILMVSPILNSAGLFHRGNMSFIFFTLLTEQI